MELSESIGAALRACRKQKKLIQLDVAVAADSERNFISEIETGKRNISLNMFARLCDGLDVDPREILDDALKRMGR